MHQVLAIASLGILIGAAGCANKPAAQPPAEIRPPPVSLTNTPPEFREYDKSFMEAVVHRWYDLLDSRSRKDDREGQVVLQFHLHSDGRISDMKIIENTTNETLGVMCEKAVLDPAPYDRWPSQLREKVGKGYREIQFTFNYQSSKTPRRPKRK
jgi:hypothetical protein